MILYQDCFLNLVLKNINQIKFSNIVKKEIQSFQSFMNKICSLTFIIFLAFLSLSSQLTIHTKNNQIKYDHNLETHFSNFIIHNLETYTHDSQSQIPDDVFSALKAYVSNDQEIGNSIHAGKPLSKSSAQKVKTFFLSNKQFSDFTFKILFANSKNPFCLKDLSDEGKQRFLKIILGQLDFSKVFLSQKAQQDIDNTQMVKIVANLKKDDQLKQVLYRCFSKHSHDINRHCK